MNDEEQLVLPAETAAAFVGLSASTLAKMRLRGDGPPYIKLGPRRVGYIKDDLEQWVMDRRFSSTSQY